eukprot:CAMPEP_0197868772 /NCGR_PEP_ID=MMETSP1438-20131217/45460_1 /TAXON_ID=1461541 /ORGANISM="Pterosperma sp., Strain CCMP1384" /LENGTH=350 /DNA_ID=CAMNT_0043487495 /DNA_START=505 /DNA_END=1557 /DNA_ORIENTATION=+
MPILMFVFALLGAGMGFQEETIPFYSILIPVMIKAGFDSITGIAVILIGAGVGVFSAISNPFATVIACQAAGVPLLQGAVPRVVALVSAWLLSTIHVTRYALKVRQDSKNSLVADQYEQDKEHFLGGGSEEGEEDEVQSLTPQQVIILLIFASVFGFMIWGSAVAGMSMVDMSALFLGGSIVTAVVGAMREERFTETFMEGSKDLLGPAMVIGLAKGIVHVMNDGMITDTILNAAAGALQGLSSIFFVNVVYILQVILAFLIPSSSGLATLTVPIMAPLADFSDVPRHLIVTAFQSASGVVNLITPTSGTVMAALAIGRVPWGAWARFCTPLLLQLSICIMTVMSVALLL